jgi:hypothetical protein
VSSPRRDPRELRATLLHKDSEYAAFNDELMNLGSQSSVRFHHDGGNPANGLDIAALLASARTMSMCLLSIDLLSKKLFARISSGRWSAWFRTGRLVPSRSREISRPE